jgi:DNA polymerase III delta subunit
MARKAASPAKELSASMRIVVLHGKEPFIRAQKTSDLREALVKQHGGVDIFAFDGTTCTAADVLDECRSFGLIAQHKLVILDQAEQLVKEDTRPLFERYAEAPCEGATLLLRADLWRAGKLDKLIEEVGAVIQCAAPDEAEAKRWVVERAKTEHKAEIDKEAVNLLVLRVGPDLGKLDSELGKLAAAASGGPGTAKITREHVEFFVGASRDEDVWNIQSTLLTAGPEESLQHLRYVMDVSRHPPTLVMYAMVDLARKVHGASRALRQGANQFQIAKPLRLWGPSVEPIMAAARRAHPDQALQLLRESTDADRRSKSGFGEVELAIERLAVRFSQLLGSPQPQRV